MSNVKNAEFISYFPILQLWKSFSWFIDSKDPIDNKGSARARLIAKYFNQKIEICDPAIMTSGNQYDDDLAKGPQGDLSEDCKTFIRQEIHSPSYYDKEKLKSERKNRCGSYTDVLLKLLMFYDDEIKDSIDLLCLSLLRLKFVLKKACNQKKL